MFSVNTHSVKSVFRGFKNAILPITLECNLVNRNFSETWVGRDLLTLPVDNQILFIGSQKDINSSVNHLGILINYIKTPKLQKVSK